MVRPEIKPFQLSLRSILVFTTIVGIGLALVIPLVAASRRDGLYFAPYHLLGDAFFPVAVVLFLTSPVLLVAIGVLLYFRHPSPVLVYVFLIFISIAVFQAIASRPYLGDLFEFAQVMTPILVVISVASIAESAIRNLKSHYVTSGLTLPIGLGYWFMSSGIISAV